MDAAHGSNYCTQDWLCIMISQAQYLAMLGVFSPGYNCSITENKTTKKPLGSFMVIWKKKKYWLQMTNNKAIIGISVYH